MWCKRWRWRTAESPPWDRTMRFGAWPDPVPAWWTWAARRRFQGSTTTTFTGGTGRAAWRERVELRRVLFGAPAWDRTMRVGAWPAPVPAWWTWAARRRFQVSTTTTFTGAVRFRSGMVG